MKVPDQAETWPEGPQLSLIILWPPKTWTSFHGMRKALGFDFIILALTVPLVVLCFRLIPDRKVAATVAGILFVLGPVAMALVHRKLPWLGKVDVLWWVALAQFFLLFAIPILGVRLLYWETPFEEIRIFGQPGPLWHRLANTSYLVMAVGVLAADLIRWRKVSR